MNRNKKVAERFDWTLCLLLFLFALISCMAIYSGQSSAQYHGNFVFSQVKNYIIGAVLAGVVMYFDNDQVKKLTWYLYGIGIVLQAGLLIPGNPLAVTRNGATLWYQIPLLGNFQPAEFFKIFLIIALAKIIVSHHRNYAIKSFNTDFMLLMKLGITAFVPFVLIVIEDLGSALVILAISAGFLLVSGVTWKILLPLFTLAASLGASIIYVVIYHVDWLVQYFDIAPYKLNRIYSWLDPVTYRQGSGLQLYNSLHAIGSGQISGKGFTERQVYIPDVHTDFIFSVIGEEYGFLGASIVISLYFLLLYHLTKTALDAIDPFNTYICVGVICMITFHVFQNIGMTIQVLPITGIPLPFISYGGTAILGNMMAMGLIFGIRYHQKSYMFASKNEYVA